MSTSEESTVSVIVATNRGGRFLREAISSVFEQTRGVHEVILVDDGSPAPGLADVAQELGVGYTRLPGSGVSAARNAGARLATGTLLAFLDDDDVWHPSKIESQLKALQLHPTAIGCYTGGWHLDADGNDLGVPWHAAAASSREMLAGDVEFPRIVTLLVTKRGFITVGGFDEQLAQAEDNDLILKLLLAGEFAAVDEPLVGYRRHAENTTGRSMIGRRLSLRMLRTHRDQAARRGDREAAELLTLNLDRFRRRVAADAVGDVIEALRERDILFASQTALWAMTRVPAQTVLAIRARAHAYARRHQ